MIFPMDPHSIQHSGDIDIDGNLPPLGTRAEVIELLFNMNIGPEKEGDDLLYGPGLQIELTPGEDPIRQMIMHTTDDSIIFEMIRKIATLPNWQIVNLNSGRVFPPRQD